MKQEISGFDVRTRALINRFFVDHGHAPHAADLVQHLGCSEADVQSSFQRLSENHLLVLYPNSDNIWVAHPFSAIQTNYWVQAGERGWWGNCGFCSLGIAAMLRDSVTIKTCAGCEGDPLVIEIENGEISSKGCLHVPLPISKWHDNIIYTCGNVHYFHSDQEVSGWCARHRVERGRTLDLADAWRLAKAWYGDYLNPQWKPRTDAELQHLLDKCNLRGEFWSV